MDIHAAVFLLDANVERFFLLRFEVVSIDQELGDRSTHQARQHQPKGRAGNTDFGRATDAVFFREDWRPGNRGTVTANQ